ncbi:Hypothetical predicted protein, partial [Paramuricea clavata]
WYYGDHLYTDIRFVAVIEKEEENESSYWHSGKHEFAVMNVYSSIQFKYFYQLRYANGYFMLFKTNSYEKPFSLGRHFRIEQLLRDDDGDCSLIEMVRKIAAETNILLSPKFVYMTRMARRIINLPV